MYRPRSRTITVSPTVLASGPKATAAVLAHELTHTAQHAAGEIGKGFTWLQNEREAFQTEALRWWALWGEDIQRVSTQYNIPDPPDK